jgi:hypothetical protein
METSIAPELDHFSAPIFEQVCQQYFWRQGLAGRLNFVPEKIGSWWQANQEVDLVLLGSGNAMLVECKWASRSVGIDIFQELEGKTAAILHETGKQKITYTICSRSGFTKQLEALAGERKDIQLLNWTEMLSS